MDEIKTQKQRDRIAGAYFNLWSETNAQLNLIEATFKEVLGLNPIAAQSATIRKALNEIRWTITGMGGTA